MTPKHSLIYLVNFIFFFFVTETLVFNDSVCLEHTNFQVICKSVLESLEDRMKLV